GLARIGECISCQHPGAVGNAARRGQCFLATDRDTPEPAIDRVSRTERGHREAALLQIVELLLALESLVANWRKDLQIRCEGAQGYFESNLVVARSRAPMSNHVSAELPRHARDCLCLHDTFRTHTERIELATLHIAHDQKAQHLFKIVCARVNLMMLD